MSVIKNKKGMGIPTILAIVVFILGTAASLMTITYQSSSSIEKSIDRNEAYQQAIDHVDAAVRVIIRGLLDDPQFLSSSITVDEVESYFNVEVTQYPESTSLWVVTSTYAPNLSVSSYVSTAAGGSLSPEEAGDLMSYFSSTTTASYQDMPEELLAAYLPSYFEMNEIDTTRDPREGDLDSVKSIAQFIEKRTDVIEVPGWLLGYYGGYVTDDVVVDSSMTIYSGRTLEIEEGKVLFITGSLYVEPNVTLKGNIVVGGSVYFYDSWYGSTSTFIGTLFVNNHFYADCELLFGAIDRPTFVFATVSINFYNDAEGYGFFVSPRFRVDAYSSSVVTVNGGVYTDNLDIRRGELIVNPYDLSTVYQFFETYALPYDGTINVEGSYTYTTPR